MTTQKIARRKRAIHVADAVNKIGGVPVRSCAIELSNAWREGKNTGTQMKEALLKSHMELGLEYAKNRLTLNEDNAAIIKKEALSRLIMQLQEAQDDPISYTTDEVYKLFDFENHG